MLLVLTTGDQSCYDVLQHQPPVFSSDAYIQTLRKLVQAPISDLTAEDRIEFKEMIADWLEQ